jgi:uncharacterized protein
MDITDQELPDYDEFEAVLHELHSSLSGSECHGLICANLTRTMQADTAGSLSTTLFGDETATLVQDEDMAKMLARLMLLSAGWLEQASYDFVLFLPDDDNPLSARSRALAEWCSGYIMGLLEAGLTDFDSLPDDASEVMKDLAAISEMDAPDIDEGADEDLMQVEEYVRVGVQLMYENLNREDKSA